MNEQIIILSQIVFIDLVLAGDNAIIIGMVAFQVPPIKEKNYFLGNWCSCNFKNYINSSHAYLLNNRNKISWWSSTVIYLL